MKTLTHFWHTFQSSIVNVVYLLKILCDYSKTYVVVYSCMTILDGIFPLVGLYLPKILIDMISRQEGLEDIWRLLLTYTLICIFYFVLSYTVKGKYLQPKSDMLFNHISLLLKNKVAHLDMHYLEDPAYYDLLEKASKASQGEGTTVIHHVFSLASSMISLLTVSFIIFQINAWVVVIAIIVVTINAVLNAKSKKVEIQIYNDLAPNRRQIGYNIGLLGDPKYFKEVRLFHLQNWIKTKAETVIANMITHLKKSVWTMHKYALIGAVCGVLQEAVLFMLLGLQALKNVITFGDFVLYINSISKFSEQLNAVIWSLIQIHSSGKYIQYFKQFLDIENTIIVDKGAHLPKQAHYDITFSHVSFHYPGHSALALQSVSLQLHTGKKYAIVGPNGAGKTTLIKLLLRLYDPSEGCISLNGIPIEKIHFADYQSNFSVVFQDYQAYSYTIAENVVLNAAYDEEKLMRVLREVGLDKKINTLKNGVHTNVQKIFDSEGIELSGGELQKLAIARCLYQDPNIVVLDEPSAALDPYAEKDIYENIMSLRSDCTLLFITHRLTSVKKADSILYMEDGRIVESGSHDELMAAKGKYYALFNTQAGEYFGEGG